ncbi:MAG: hypothetical protein ABW176_18310 [Candidatus Thiodiazotropha endolucinida]
MIASLEPNENDPVAHENSSEIVTSIYKPIKLIDQKPVEMKDGGQGQNRTADTGIFSLTKPPSSDVFQEVTRTLVA